MERTEEAALSGQLVIRIDGRERRIPVLKLKHSRDWKNQYGSIVARLDIDVDDIAGAIGRLANLPSEIALDLVAAYDRTGVLGGKEAIEEDATDAEIIAALEVMVQVTYPKAGQMLRSVVEAFGPQLRILATGVLGTIADRLSRESSTPTPSATGGSTPTPSKSGSPTSSSSSSGRTTSRPSSGTAETGGT